MGSALGYAKFEMRILFKKLTYNHGKDNSIRGKNYQYKMDGCKLNPGTIANSAFMEGLLTKLPFI
jgi:hypothetical protein